MTAQLEKRLLKRRVLGNLRRLHISEGLIDFCSNDYLGLARSSLLRECPTHGCGSTGSRLLTGNSRLAVALEEEIAAFHGYEAGLLLNCGYMANVGLLSAVATQECTILFDSNIHASMRDGIRLSRGEALPFRHNDLTHLEQRLKKSTPQKERFIVIESIYSTDGTRAPLPQISSLAKQYGAHLIVDEAHAVGVFGPAGRGLVAEHNLMGDVFAQVITFGKALGTFGACVLGSHIVKEALINFATPYIYTTALPPHALVAIKASYDLFPKMDAERKRLHTLMRAFSSQTHIHPIPVPGNKAAIQLSHHLARHGLDVRPLLSPTVRRGQEILRVSLHAFNTEEQVNHLKELVHV